MKIDDNGEQICCIYIYYIKCNSKLAYVQSPLKLNIVSLSLSLYIYIYDNFIVHICAYTSMHAF
jgi:hypothetical protein